MEVEEVIEEGDIVVILDSDGEISVEVFEEEEDWRREEEELCGDSTGGEFIPFTRLSAAAKVRDPLEGEEKDEEAEEAEDI